MFGQRTVTFSAEENLPASVYNTISVLDFDQHRLRARRSMGGDGVCVPQVTDLGDERAVYGGDRGDAFFEGENTAGRCYVKTTYRMQFNTYNRYNSIMMDDERGECDTCFRRCSAELMMFVFPVVAKLVRQTVASHELLSLAVF